MQTFGTWGNRLTTSSAAPLTCICIIIDVMIIMMIIRIRILMRITIIITITTTHPQQCVHWGGRWRQRHSTCSWQGGAAGGSNKKRSNQSKQWAAKRVMICGLRITCYMLRFAVCSLKHRSHDAFSVQLNSPLSQRNCNENVKCFTIYVK